MILLIDNYDSFTYNLLHFMGELGAAVEVVRNDAISADDALAMGAAGIVLSPGPRGPDKAGICLDVVALAGQRGLPLLGVCLGYQCIGQAFGGRVVRAPKPMHGKTDVMDHDGSGVFAGLPNPFTATRYHSLMVVDVPDCLAVTATSSDGVVQALAHQSLPIHGVQFHPESIATEHGHQLLRNFLDICHEPIRHQPRQEPKKKVAA